MKKAAIVSLLALALTTVAATPSVFAQNGNSGTITIKNPAEYNAYTNAISQSTPAAKAAAIEAFLKQYPDSVVKKEMLEQLMAAYQPISTDKTLSAAKRLLAVDPNNLRALFMVAFITRQQGVAAEKSSPEQAAPLLNEAAQAAKTGLAAPKPADMSAADYAKLKAATTPIFYSAIAMDAKNNKDYKGAIQAFTKALQSYSNPSETESGMGLNDTYLLGQVYAQQTPPDYKTAAWFLTRAAQFAPAEAKGQIEKAAEYFYNKYHGSMDGYPQVQTLAQTNLLPPSAYNPTPAPPPPSPAQLAQQTVSNTPDLSTLSLSDKEFILFNGTPDVAQQVWNVMKGKRVQVPGLVISSTPESVALAVTEDNQQAKKADFTINMKTPLRNPPAVGSNVSYDATFDSYTPNPPMINLIDGTLPVEQHPVRRAPRRRR